MIYDFIVSRLNSASALGPNVFPVGVNIDDIYSAENDFAFTVYTCKSREPEYDLEGGIHHYSDQVIVDFIGRLYHRLHEMYADTESAFSVSDLDTGNGEYIHSVRCSSPEPDAFDPEHGLLRRTMLISIDWSPME